MNKLVEKVKKAVPSPIKSIIKSALYKTNFWIRYGFLPPPQWTDLSGYEKLLDFIEEHKILDIEGDLVEIGVFVGGGTYKLAKYLSKKRSKKKIYAVDIFDITADSTQNTQGWIMSEMYAKILKGQSQWDIFQKLTKNCDNIIVIKGDSKNISIPADKVCFAYIDGNHDPSYVKNDFYLVWPKLSPHGVVAFDDYGYDLPMVTKTIDDLLEKHSKEIAGYWINGKIIFIKKR